MVICLTPSLVPNSDVVSSSSVLTPDKVSFFIFLNFIFILTGLLPSFNTLLYWSFKKDSSRQHFFSNFWYYFLLHSFLSLLSFTELNDTCTNLLFHMDYGYTSLSESQSIIQFSRRKPSTTVFSLITCPYSFLPSSDTVTFPYPDLSFLFLTSVFQPFNLNPIRSFTRNREDWTEWGTRILL